VATEKLSRKADETEDLICGELTVFQAKKGYRFGVESLLLPAFAGAAESMVDLGTGSGIMAMVGVRFHGVKRAKGVEVQASLAERAARNVKKNRLASKIEIVRADMRELAGVLPAGKFDLVVSNPPYRQVRSGHVSRGDERALGRHEVMCQLPDVVGAAARLLRPRGRFCIVYPVGRIPELFRICEEYKLRPSRLRMVYGRVELKPKNCLAEAVRNGRMNLAVEPPMIMYDYSGEYTKEVKEILYPS